MNHAIVISEVVFVVKSAVDCRGPGQVVIPGAIFHLPRARTHARQSFLLIFHFSYLTLVSAVASRYAICPVDLWELPVVVTVSSLVVLAVRVLKINIQGRGALQRR